jgi:hypothetical protein
MSGAQVLSNLGVRATFALVFSSSHPASTYFCISFLLLGNCQTFMSSEAGKISVMIATASRLTAKHGLVHG